MKVKLLPDEGRVLRPEQHHGQGQVPLGDVAVEDEDGAQANAGRRTARKGRTGDRVDSKVVVQGDNFIVKEIVMCATLLNKVQSWEPF